MAADSVHHSIERELKKKVDVCDFAEFVETLEKARCSVSCLETSDFKVWGDLSNRATTNKGGHKLAEMTVVQFRRGSRSLFYKKSHSVDSAFVTADFLKKKADISVFPENKANPRGIPSSKKQELIRNLCPLMPRSRALFWEQLPTNDQSRDLINAV